MTADDLEPLAPDGAALATLDDRARAAADALRRAKVGPPPPLGGQPLGAVGRLRVMALALALVATVGAAIVFGTGVGRRSTPAHPRDRRHPRRRSSSVIAA
jgi:hypothetical protein